MGGLVSLIVLLQLLPMLGINSKEDTSSLMGRLQNSAPTVKQINDEFQDPVSPRVFTQYSASDFPVYMCLSQLRYVPVTLCFKL